MSSWCLFLTICSFASLSYGGIHNDVSKVMKPDGGVIMSFEDGGHVIDCIDIYKQPAFQHPLLVNHTIQLEPDDQPSEPNGYAILEGPYPFMNLTKNCPEGSIPIGRNQSNIDRFGGKHLLKRPPPFLQQPRIWKDGSIHEYAIIRDIGDYIGGKATINVWNPKVETYNDFSLSQIWIASEDERTTLEAGWIVYPNLYRDYKTRLFTFWTVDGYEHGCYNLECPGFVQTSHRFPLNARMKTVSVYGGDQYSITISIFKGKRTKHWWLYVNGMVVGYWPNELVRDLAGGAKQVAFGGEAAHESLGRRTVATTEMGSGHFPWEGGFGKSSFFKNVRVATTSAYAYVFPGQIEESVTKSECYDLLVKPLTPPPWGYSFYYGGPGKSDMCH